MQYRSRYEFMQRAKANLDYLEANASEAGPYELTALLTTFTGTLMFSWDDLESQWSHLRQRGVRWPELQPNDAAGQAVSARTQINHLRDAFAHGNVAFVADEGNTITAIQTWTCCRCGALRHKLNVPVQALRAMLDCFVIVAESGDLSPKQAYECRSSED